MGSLDDSKLLDFKTYNDYLDKYVVDEDLYYLRNLDMARKLAEYGYRAINKILSKREFEARKAIIHEIVHPRRKLHLLYSFGGNLKDALSQALADRERDNRVRVLSTVIFLRHVTKTGHEISGYIDFEDSLRRTRSREEGAVDWVAVFKGEKRLWPTLSDLGYYNWRTGFSKTNSTPNFKIICDPFKGLLFLNRHDRKIIQPDPKSSNSGYNTTRTIIKSKKYEQIVLFDHVLKRM